MSYAIWWSHESHVPRIRMLGWEGLCARWDDGPNRLDRGEHHGDRAGGPALRARRRIGATRRLARAGAGGRRGWGCRAAHTKGTPGDRYARRGSWCGTHVVVCESSLRWTAFHCF